MRTKPTNPFNKNVGIVDNAPRVAIDVKTTSYVLYHPKPKGTPFEYTEPIDKYGMHQLNNHDRLRFKLQSLDDDLENVKVMGTNRTHLGPETKVHDFHDFHNRDQWWAAQHMANLFKTENDKFMQNDKVKRFDFQSVKKQLVPKRHSSSDYEDLIPDG